MTETRATVTTAISAYLYGVTTPPDNLDERLRDVNNTENPSFTLDTISYMNSVGRFASPFQLAIVQQFFSGAMSIPAIQADSDGAKTFTLGDYQQFTGDVLSSRVTLLQYTTGINEPDFVERAFIWGTTGFLLNESAVFRIASDGTRSILGAAMMPAPEENFDFVAGNPLVQAINDQVLEPLTDPYGIGRKVEFTFDPASTAAWVASKAGVVLTAADDNAGIADFFADAASALASLASVPAAYGAAVGVLMAEIVEAVEYRRDGHNIVYGSARDDLLSAEGISNAYFDPALPTIYVAGSGNDVVTTSRTDDIVYAGVGDDTIIAASSYVQAHGGAGDDTFMLENRGTAVYGGDGADVLDYSRIDSGGKYDWFGDASADDRVVVGTDTLRGGDKAIRMYDSENTIYVSTEGMTEFTVFSVDDFAAYDLQQVDYGDGLSSNELHITMNSGKHLTISNYSQGVAGISAEAIQDIETNDIGSITGGRAVYLSYDEDDLFYSSVLAPYRGYDLLPIVYVDPPTPDM